MRSKVGLAALVLLAACVAFGQEEQKSKIQNTPQWEKMKTLVGQWEGTVAEDKEKKPVTENIRMTGDGSALMHIMGYGAPEEMVTMFHPDGARLMMTHYCAAHNQPRMRSAEMKDPNRVAFDFVDVTNAAPGDGYMYRLEITFDSPDHHTEYWTYKQGEKLMTAKFEFKRAK